MIFLCNISFDFNLIACTLNARETPNGTKTHTHNSRIKYEHPFLMHSSSNRRFRFTTLMYVFTGKKWRHFFTLCTTNANRHTNNLNGNTVERRVTRAEEKIQFNHHYYSKFPGVWVSFLIHHRNGSNFGNHHLIVYSILMCVIVTVVVMQTSLFSCPLLQLLKLQTSQQPKSSVFFFLIALYVYIILSAVSRHQRSCYASMKSLPIQIALFELREYFQNCILSYILFNDCIFIF